MLKTIGTLSANRAFGNDAWHGWGHAHSASWLLNIAYPYRLSNIMILTCKVNDKAMSRLNKTSNAVGLAVYAQV